MDEGTDAKDILENKLLPLRRGEHMRTDTFCGGRSDTLFPSCGNKAVTLKTVAFSSHWKENRREGGVIKQHWVRN